MIKVLIVDDSKDCQLISKIYFKKINNDFQIFTATNGQEAFDVINEKEDFDLIFLDIQMPIMDGICFADKYRGKAIIIGVTALHPMEFQGRVHKFEEIMIKPISFATLKKVVEEKILTKALS